MIIEIPEKDISYIGNLKKDDELVLPNVPEDHLFWPVYKLLSTAHESATAVLDANFLRREMGRTNISRGGKAVKVRIYGFPFVDPRRSPCLAVCPGLGEKKFKEVKKAAPHIKRSMLNYYEHFGEIIPLHLVPRKTLIFGYGSGVWCPPVKPGNVRKFLEAEFWAADEEDFPGRPSILLGYDGQDNLWFGSDENKFVWTFDHYIQGVRNANYYDDDEEERIFWPKYILRVIARWLDEDPQQATVPGV